MRVLHIFLDKYTAMYDIQNYLRDERDEKRTRTHFINIKQYKKWENCVFFYINVIGNKSNTN